VPVPSSLRDPFVSERAVTFTTDQIAAYAQASGDINPIHLDEAFARSVGLPGLIAHGMLQMGILATLGGEAAGGPTRLRRLSCRFSGIVQPGDTITFTAAVGEPGKLALRAVNQRGEAVVTKASADYSEPNR
jgi:acyl dehydratase